MTPLTDLFRDVPQHLAEESFETLLESAEVRIERIVSQGHASPEGFWYDSPRHEWVAVLRGASRLRFEDETIEMRPGRFVHIVAHRKHRVDWTTPDEPTIWLAVHYGDRG
ncbi:MAG TPA: cupin domain-containing protein [Gemmataceae bacterium]|jgi:cupin 2 domain-containing protein|nr:cupin domain-containing protein [Gemmataceae bacterium]